MKVHVIPNAKKAEVVVQLDGSLKVKVDAPPDKGRANQRLVEILAEHFNVSKNSVRIVRGEKERNKIVEVV